MKAILAQGTLSTTTCHGWPRGYFLGDKDGIQEPLLFEMLQAAASNQAAVSIQTAANTQPVSQPIAALNSLHH